MIRQLADRQIITIRCPDADTVYLCCDCVGVFAMRRIDGADWQATLQLPRGEHHVRCYAQSGLTTICLAHETFTISGTTA